MQVSDITKHANFVVFDKEAEKLFKVLDTKLSNMEEELKRKEIGYLFN